MFAMLTTKNLLKYLRAKLFCLLGNHNNKYVNDFRKARYGMDKKLEAYLPSKGFFIEAGAFDGIYESNTYFLEKWKGWKGILIEPIYENYILCKRSRSRSIVLNYALKSFDNEASQIGIFAA
jgi:hypothetical protein